VAAVAHAAGPPGGDELSEVQLVLKRLVTNQKPAGDYATTVVRDAGRPEIYLAFEDEGDARKFAATVEAGPTGSYLGWASQRAFEMAGAKIRELQASLPPQRVKRDPPDGTSQRIRVRRGPRAPNTRYDEE
jgi:hypothetical protein